MAAPDPHFTEFVRSGSEEAFQHLVARHMDMVHSAAGRLLGDRRDTAADVAQTVFTQLARRAARLPPDLVVSVWLYTRTRHTALNVIRGETRRAAREQTAADLLQMNAPDPDSAKVNAALMPQIDGAIAELPPLDQRALILRFFEQCELQEIGDRLGLSAGAVRQRLTRALEKLRMRLSRRGVVLSAAALTLWLSGESVKAAPASLTASGLAAVALQSAGPGAGAASGAGAGGLFSTLTFMTGIKSILIGTALGLVGGGFWAVHADPDPASSTAAAAATSAAAPGSLRPDHAAGATASQRFAVPAPAGTAEALLEQLNSIIAAPDVELTRERLAVWLSQVPLELWKPLIDLAEARFSPRERSRWLPELARQWARLDPETAIPFLAQKVNEDGRLVGAGLAACGFKVWYESSPDKALKWLVEQQDNPQLNKELPNIISVVAEGLAAVSHESALHWASQLQGEDLRKAALEPLWEKLLNEWNTEAWTKICGKLLLEKDPAFSRQTLGEALSRWRLCNSAGLETPDKWVDALPTSSGKKMAAELLLATALSANSEKPPIHALAVVMDSGPEMANGTAVRLLMDGESLGPRARQWLLPLVTGPERETAIFRAARQVASGPGSYGGDKIQASIAWAAELSEPATRDPLLYGLFQRLLERQQKEDGSTGKAMKWAESSGLPPEIQKQLLRAGQDFQASVKP